MNCQNNYSCTTQPCYQSSSRANRQQRRTSGWRTLFLSGQAVTGLFGLEFWKSAFIKSQEPSLRTILHLHCIYQRKTFKEGLKSCFVISNSTISSGTAAWWKMNYKQMPSPWSLLNLPCVQPSHVSLQPISDYTPSSMTRWAFTPCQPVPPPPPFLFTPFHTTLAARAEQVAKPVSQSIVATRQHHRHQLPHSRGAAWQPHGNHMVQSGYTTTGTREGQVFVCVCGGGVHI